MAAEKSTTSRISFSLGALGRTISGSLEISLPGWLAKGIALFTAHILATEVLGLEGADALLAAFLDIIR